MRKDNENENGKNKKHWRESVKDKKFYLYTVIGCAVALLSLVIVAVTMSIVGENNSSINAGTNVEEPDDGTGTGGEGPDDGTGVGGVEGDDKPVDGQPDDMLLPVEGVAVSTEYEFYYNQTLNRYHLHEGLDFAAEVGAEVVAVQGGVIESVYTDELLTGTEIVIDHGDGLKSVYRFVNASEGVEVGAAVERGQVIATVAEAVGDEYKDGAHLHFEILKDNKHVDPTTYLTLEEK